IRQWMRKERPVEVEPYAAAFRPVEPPREMLWPEPVAFDFFAPGLRVEGVQIEAVLSRNEFERRVNVGPQFVAAPRLAGVIACRLDPAAGQSQIVLKSA